MTSKSSAAMGNSGGDEADVESPYRRMLDVPGAGMSVADIQNAVGSLDQGYSKSFFR